MKKWIILGFLFLGACATQIDSAKALLTACNGYVSALETLTVYKSAGRLSAGQITAVDAVRPSLNRLCKDGVTDTQSALVAVNRGLRELIAIRSTVQ